MDNVQARFPWLPYGELAAPRRRAAMTPRNPSSRKRGRPEDAVVAQRRKGLSAVISITQPISKNELRAIGAGRFVDSRAYKRWKRDAGWELEIQKPPAVSGRYALRIVVSREFGIDLGNAEQAISDLIEAHGVIENDKLCERLEMAWQDDPGVKIVVTSAGSSAA
jgi:hypothetical protein